MKILSHEELGNTEPSVSIIHEGGAQDGQMFRVVLAHMQDGTTRYVWISNAHDGYYKNAFVPWDFTHPEVIEA